MRNVTAGIIFFVFHKSTSIRPMLGANEIGGRWAGRKGGSSERKSCSPHLNAPYVQQEAITNAHH